jgi:hypothetical protein
MLKLERHVVLRSDSLPLPCVCVQLSLFGVHRLRQLTQGLWAAGGARCQAWLRALQYIRQVLALMTRCINENAFVRWVGLKLRSGVLADCCVQAYHRGSFDQWQWDLAQTLRTTNEADVVYIMFRWCL